MNDIDKYIGIKHYFGESSFEKCDCFGLCKLFYREHGWPEKFDDGKPYPAKDKFSELSEWRRLYTYLLKNFTRVNLDDLEYGDFVIFNVDGDIHCGIYLEYGKMLSMEIPTVYGETMSTIYHRGIWSLCFKYGFRRNSKI